LLAYRKCLREGPMSAGAPEGDQGEIANAPGDEDSEFLAKLHKTVTTERKKKINFIPAGVMQTDFWKKGGAATALLQKAKFCSAKGEAGKAHALIMLNAELFPTRELFASATSHKDVVPLSNELKAAAKWLMGAQGGSVICLLCDGRSRKVRRAFEDIVEEHQQDEQKHIDGCILYGEPLTGDVRFHQRKTFGGLTNLEKLSGVLPVPKVRMSSKQRHHFSACGEKSTYATSYTKVNFRSLACLPRLSITDKETIVGSSLPTYPAEVIAATGTKGHPLFWNEAKDVEVFTALFTDLNVKWVFDLAPGSGAAAMAAGVCGATYEGLAMNANHVNWLNRIADKAMYAIIADATDEESKQLRTDLATHLGPAIEEARQVLESHGESDVDSGDAEDGDGDEEPEAGAN